MEPPTRRSGKKKKKESKSGVRTKFLIESLRNEYYSLREENEKLRGLVADNISPGQARMILAECYDMNAPKAGVNDVDRLAYDVAGAGIGDDDDDDL